MGHVRVQIARAPMANRWHADVPATRRATMLLYNGDGVDIQSVKIARSNTLRDRLKKPIRIGICSRPRKEAAEVQGQAGRYRTRQFPWRAGSGQILTGTLVRRSW